MVYKNHYGFTTHFQEFVRPCAFRWGSAGVSTQTENPDSPPWGLGPMVWVQEPHILLMNPREPPSFFRNREPHKKIKKTIGWASLKNGMSDISIFGWGLEGVQTGV